MQKPFSLLQPLLSASCLGLMGASSLAASADPAPEPLMVQVTGTRLKPAPDGASNGLIVIDRAAIDRMAPATGVDLLRQVAGLQVDQAGGPGGLASAYLRGSDPNHVLILVDGVRINNSTNARGGSVDLSALDPASVERIEVLPGNASAVYGADAMGGVIQIFTRQAALGHTLVGAGIGGKGLRSAQARTALGQASARWDIGLSTLQDGDPAQGGHLRTDHADIKLQLQTAADTRLELALLHAERSGSAFPDDSGGVELAVRRSLETRRSRDNTARMALHAGSGQVSWHLGASSFQQVEDANSPGVAPGVRSSFGVPASSGQTRYRRDTAQAHLALQAGPWGDAAAGLEWVHEAGSNRSAYKLFGTAIPANFDLSRQSRALYAEWRLPITPEWQLKTGLRHDQVAGMPAQRNPSALLRWQPAGSRTAITLDAATGFKPPSFFSLGLPALLGGNSQLRPEHSRGQSLSLDHALPSGGGQGRLTWFANQYRDLITFDGATNRLVNADHVRTDGLEAQWQGRLASDWRWSAQATWLHTRLQDSDLPLRQRPRRRGGAQLDWQAADQWQLQWRLEVASGILDSSIPTGDVMLPATVRHDVVLQWQASQACTLTGAIDNVTGHANRWYIGSPGQAARLRLTGAWAL